MKPSMFRAFLAAVGAALSALGMCMASGTAYAALMSNPERSNTERPARPADRQA
jgi:hypothetical protein